MPGGPIYHDEVDLTELERGKILNRLLRYSAVAGIVAYVPSVYASIVSGFWLIAVVDSLALVLILVAALSDRIPPDAKLGALVAGGLAIGALVLFVIGPYGAGYIWLLFSVVVSALFGKPRTVGLVILASGAILGAYAAAIRLGLIRDGMPFLGIVVISVNLLTISVILSLVIVDMLRRLRDLFQERASYADTLADELAAERAMERELESSRASHDRLERELHHRVKNNMQIVLSLVQIAYESAPPGERSGLAAIKARLAAVAAANEALLDAGASRGLDLDALVRVLAQTARRDGASPAVVERLSGSVVQEDATNFSLSVAEALAALDGGEAGLRIDQVDRGGRPTLRLRGSRSSGAGLPTADTILIELSQRDSGH